jgi:8-oxo-dGTP pyrophosphatase MutT (NUDIX family)
VVVRSITIAAAVGEWHVAQDPRRTPEFESMHDDSRHGRKPTVAAPVRGRICAAALLVSDDGRYLMQHRDALPSINFPDHWCCFGGGIEPGETAEAALRRELREEIDYEAGSITPFTEYQVVLPIASPRRETIRFYAVPIEPTEAAKLRVKEGAGLALLHPAELAAKEKVIPWDLAAVLMHARRATLFLG